MSDNVDLDSFCWKANGREYIKEPFSHGEWTYATNGHVCIRVPLRAGVIGHPKAPLARKLFDVALVDDLTFTPAPTIVRPPERFIDCAACNASGAFDGEECPECDGEKTESSYIGAGAPVRGATIGLLIIKLVWLLPELRIVTAPKRLSPIPFTFAGDGQGLMMPMNGTRRTENVRVIEHVAESAS